MVDSRLIREWIGKADEDFNFASSVIEDSPYYAQLCFHYQQAAEKYLKAFIVAEELEFQKIHDLLELMNICRSKEPLFSKLENDCIYLNRFYIDARYPVHWPADYSKKDAVAAKKAVENIASMVKEFIGKF